MVWGFGWTVDFEDASRSKKPAGVWRRRAFVNPALVLAVQLRP
jgi:hypothetical protein